MISTWIANLPLRHKFVLLSIVALLMAGAPSALVLSESVGNLQALKDEDKGLAPSKAMLKLIKLTQEHRGLSAAVLSGDSSKQAVRQERQAQVVQAFDEVVQALAPIADTDLKDNIKALQGEWQTLAQDVGAGGMSTPVSVKRHTQLVNGELMLLEDVVGVSGLALDADAQCYYLITAAFRDLPRLSEKLGLSRAKGAVMLVKKDPNSADAQALASLLDGIQMHALDAARDVEKSGALKEDHAAELQRAVQASKTALVRGQALINGVVQAEDLSGMESTAYFRDLTAVIQAQFAASEQIVAHLDGRLQERIDAETHQVLLTALVMLIMSVLGGAVAIIITRMTTRTVNGAVQAAQAMANGDLSQAMHTEQRDEIGQLGSAFDSMAAALAAFGLLLADAHAHGTRFASGHAHALLGHHVLHHLALLGRHLGHFGFHLRHLRAHVLTIALHVHGRLPQSGRHLGLRQGRQGGNCQRQAGGQQAEHLMLAVRQRLRAAARRTAHGGGQGFHFVSLGHVDTAGQNLCTGCFHFTGCRVQGVLHLPALQADAADIHQAEHQHRQRQGQQGELHGDRAAFVAPQTASEGGEAFGQASEEAALGRHGRVPGVIFTRDLRR